MEVVKNVLITGATGYIGKHLLKRLINIRNYKITILVRSSSDLDIIKDLKDQIYIHNYESNYESIDLLFKKSKFDHVIHLASFASNYHSTSNVVDIIDSNIKLGVFILEAMKNYGCKYFINTSTYAQNYRDQNYEPISLYAATKKAFEDLIDYYCLDGNINSISLKLYDVYGYDDHRKHKILNSLIAQTDNFINLTKGEQKLYMVFIDDVIDAYLAAMDLVTEIKGHVIYGVYGEEKYSLKEVIKILEEVCNRKFNIKFGGINYSKFQIMDPFTENKLPGWNAKIPLRDGFRIMLNDL